MRRLTTALLALASSTISVPARADGPAATVGQQHVGFTLPDIHTGKPVSLADFRGKKVLLIQFASW